LLGGPFSDLLERDCRASAIACEQVQHRFRLLSPQLPVAVDVGFIRRHALPPHFGLQSSSIVAAIGEKP
jgi:hypothetical protein